MERTLVLVKPDAVGRGLIGEVIRRFESRTLQIKAVKMLRPTVELVERHYEAHRGKDFFEGVVRFMSSGPVVALVVAGDNAIALVRQMIGALEPMDAAPGTIRGDLTISTRENLVHGSDCEENAASEIAIWFDPEEILE